jgi:hypothetical protein
MKCKIIGFIIFLSHISCSGQKTNQLDKNDKVGQLKSFYEDCKNQKKGGCINFFNQFPQNFKEIIELYGYTDGVGGHPLYKDYEVHINQYFKSINLVNSSLFISKTIDIAQDCIWEADAVNLFQDKLIELILTNTKDVILELNKRDKSNVKSFWEFCFDGSHPKDIENKKLYEKFLILVDDDEMKKIINEAFQLTISRNEEH